MTTRAKRNLRLRKILFASVLVLICISIVFAAYQQKKDWVVPEEAKARKNPLPITVSSLKAARGLYLDNCSNCHGESGKGDGSDAMMYDPPPANFTDPGRMAPRTDGELFYRISRGKKPMPSFKKRMTEEQRWQLVLLVRSFSAPSQPAARSTASPAPASETAASPSKTPAASTNH